MNDKEDLEIYDVDVSDTSVDWRDEVEVTVRTSTNVERVWIEDPDDKKVTSSKKHTKKDGDEYIWELSFEADEVGSTTYTVYARDEDGEEEKETFKIRVSK